jgi:hypothetical protein
MIRILHFCAGKKTFVLRLPNSFIHCLWNSHPTRCQIDVLVTCTMSRVTPFSVPMALLVLGIVQGVAAAAETDTEFAVNLFSDLAP